MKRSTKATKEMIDFLQKYAENISKPGGQQRWNLKLGGVSFEYLLLVSGTKAGPKAWFFGSKEDIKFLKKLFKKKVEAS